MCGGHWPVAYDKREILEDRRSRWLSADVVGEIVGELSSGKHVLKSLRALGSCSD